MSQLKSLSEEVMQIRESMQKPSSLQQQCAVVNSDVPPLRAAHQSISEGNRVPQNQDWRASQNGSEQHQYPFQAPHFTPQPYQRLVSPMPAQYVQPTQSSHYGSRVLSATVSRRVTAIPNNTTATIFPALPTDTPLKAKTVFSLSASEIDGIVHPLLPLWQQ